VTDFVSVSSEQDWSSFKKRFDCVIDPMTARTAELFLNGRSGCDVAGLDAEKTWEAVDKNVHGLLTFFNLLTSRDALPLIQYGDTFHRGEMETPGTRDSIFDLLDRIDDHFVANVFVDKQIYSTVKQAAIQRLQELEIDSKAAISDADAHDVWRELAAFRYDWKPTIPQLQNCDQQRFSIAQFLFGALVFGAYARAADADHIIQDKRARLFTALTKPGNRDRLTRYEKEKELFAELRRECLRPGSEMRVEEMPAEPSILAHILLRSKPAIRRTGEVLERISDIRTSQEGKAYRNWFKQMREDLDSGIAPSAAIDDIREVTAEMTHALRPDYPKWSVELTGSLSMGPSLSVAVAVPGGAELTVEGKLAEAKIESKPFRVGIPDWVRNWILDVLPFGRHRKLLLRSALAQAEYTDITLHLRRVWNAS
jgi:hypothetical protein